MKAFVSYSHQDKELLTKLEVHLAALKREKLLETWTDREIHAGGVIDDHVEAAMEEAQLFLLLISASFIHSNYCYEKEFSKACERHTAGEADIVPIIIRDCDWGIKELRRFKALPEDGHAILGRQWHSEDEGFKNVVEGLRKLIESRQRHDSQPVPRRARKPKDQFAPDETHITDEQRATLRRIHEEVIDRLTAKTQNLPEKEAKAKASKWFGIVWGQFNKEFGTEDHGLQSLPRDRFDDAKKWLQQYKASKNKNFKRINPEKYRNTLTGTIYGNASKLGWTKDQVYAFAAEKLHYAKPITSLNDLGNKQLETVRDRVKYELTKRNVKSKQAKAERTQKFIKPILPAAKELLDLILSHPVPEERGLTEILDESPDGPLWACFIPNTTARGKSPSAKKSELRTAIAELCRLGWLLPPEANDNIRIYELNPQIGMNSKSHL